MWVCRNGPGSLYVHIEDGWRSVRCGERDSVRARGPGAAGWGAPPQGIMAATTPTPSDDKNAIIMDLNTFCCTAPNTY